MPFSSISGLQTKRKVIKTVSANANNYVLKTEIGTFTDSIDAFWNINAGVVIGDSGNLGYGANTGTNWSSGSAVYFTNKGTINGSPGTSGSPGSNGSGGPGSAGGSGLAGTNGGNGSVGGTGNSGGSAIIFGVKTYVDNGSGTLSGGPGGPGGPGGSGGGGGGSGSPGGY
jgi:hypothetical protein